MGYRRNADSWELEESVFYTLAPIAIARWGRDGVFVYVRRARWFKSLLAAYGSSTTAFKCMCARVVWTPID
jgi:hypothetical protein